MSKVKLMKSEFQVKKKEPTVTMTTRIPVSLRDELEAQALDHECDLNTYVKNALEYHVSEIILKKRIKS